MLPEKETDVSGDIFQPYCTNSAREHPQSTHYCDCHTYIMLGVRKSEGVGAEKLTGKLRIARVSNVFL